MLFFLDPCLANHVPDVSAKQGEYPVSFVGLFYFIFCFFNFIYTFACFVFVFFFFFFFVFVFYHTDFCRDFLSIHCFVTSFSCAVSFTILLQSFIFTYFSLSVFVSKVIHKVFIYFDVQSCGLNVY